MYRHLPKHVAEALKTTCKYCRKTPALWQVVDNEKVCVHCGTRVYNSAVLVVPSETEMVPVYKNPAYKKL